MTGLSRVMSPLRVGRTVREREMDCTWLMSEGVFKCGDLWREIDAADIGKGIKVR
jgi:hypothetical protein